MNLKASTTNSGDKKCKPDREEFAYDTRISRVLFKFNAGSGGKFIFTITKHLCSFFDPIFFESYGAIPLGIVILGFPAIPVILTAAVGNWVSVMAFIWIISKLRSKVVKNKETKEPSKRAIKARQYFEKYGVPGVSLAGILLAFHISAGIALAAGAKKSYVSLWITISIAAWSAVIGGLLMLGVELL